MNYSIKRKLKTYLKLSRRLHHEAKKILKLKIGGTDLATKITEVASKESFDQCMLQKVVNILEERKEYFLYKNPMESAVEELVTFPALSVKEIGNKYNIPKDLLWREFKKRNEIGSYFYDPVVSNIFTFSEELTILDNLRTWKKYPTSTCQCRFCALLYLSDWAYQFAQIKEKCPKKWKKRADISWLYEYDMRHFKEIRSDFDSPRKCRCKNQDQSLTNISQTSSSSTSSVSLQGEQVQFYNVPKTVRSDIREQIQNYLKLDGLLEPAAKEILDENKDKVQVAQKYGLDLKDLESKVYIIQCTRDYWKKKVNMKKAVKDVQNSSATLNTIARNYDIHAFVLRTECNRYLRIILNKNNTYSYEYDQFSANDCTVFTFMEESLLLQQLQFLKDVLQCPCQICALDFLLSLSYDFAQRTNKIHPWSEHKEADCNWLFQFIKGHTDEISIFEPPHSCKIKTRARTNGSETSSSVDLEENVRSISDVPLQLQEGCQQTEESFNDLTMLDIRSRIKSHLELSTRLDEAADEVIEENKDIASVALKHNLDFWILKRKVQILKMKYNYIDLKNKFENAINTILHKSPFDIARDNMIDERQLKAEYMKYLEKRRLHPNYTYQYDETITPNRVFTYSEEKLLLHKLSHWKKDSRCPCQLCALQYLLKLAHQFATENHITCPIGWIEAEIADELWLLEFEMRYSRNEMYDMFEHVSTCKIESLGQEEPNTFQAKRFKPSQTSNVHKSDIKDRIKSHLELSRRLDKAAKKILEKHKDVASAARQYELDPWIVKQKMHILNLRKEQFNMKNKLEPPINDIIYNRISILNAATKYAVDKDFIEKTLKEFENSECDIYTYDMLTMDDGVFTFREEFSLLNRLRLKSEDLKCCRSCTLQHLSSLAYQDAEQNKKQYPSAWNTDKKADEIWIYEYEMRHSVEISKYFNDECKAEEILASMSASQS